MVPKLFKYFDSCLAILFLSCVAFGQDQFVLKAEFSKEIFLEHEPIWVTVTLINTQDKPINVWNFDLGRGGLDYVVKDSVGNNVHHVEYVYDYFGSEPHTVVAGGDSLSKVGNLDLFRFGQLAIGQYTFQAITKAVVVLRDSSKNKIFSNLIHFSVVEPKGEEKKVEEILMRGWEARRHKNYQLEERLMLDIIKDYPKTVYAYRAYSDLYENYSFLSKQRSKEKDLLKTVVEEYPDDPMQNQLFPSFLSDVKSDYEKRQYLDSLVVHNNDNLQTRLAKKLLREYNRKEVK